MGILEGAVSKLGGMTADAIGGSSSHGTTLQDFMTHFSSSEGIWVKQVDPLATFEVSFKFYPAPWPEATKDDRKWYKKLGDNLLDAGEKALKTGVKNLANNLTGGLLGAWMNSDVKIMKLHDEFPEDNFDHTFIEYLAAANLLVGKDDWIGESAGQSVSPLELQLGLYCQEIVLPGLEVAGQTVSQSVIGEFPVNGVFVKPDTNLLTMKIVNTKVPLFERIFYPWMRETTLPFWSYKSQPYTTATITVDMSKHNDISYVFVGCRPQKIQTQQPNQQASSGNLIRDVQFVFDYMFVNSSLTNCESIAGKLLGSASSIVNGAANMLKM